MKTFRRCLARYDWSYNVGYVTPSGMGQYRGKAGHAALATWLQNTGMDPEKLDDLAFRSAAAEMNKAEEETGIDVEEDWLLIWRILARYFDWARANDNFTKVIEVEKKFEIEIGGFPVIGYIDGIVESRGGIWLMEHKFNKRVSLSCIDIDQQMSIYMIAANRLGYKPKGVLFNVVRMTEGGIAEKKPVERAQVYRNPEGLKLIEKEIAVQLKAMDRFHQEGGYVYRNPTGDCSWDCGFFQACLSMNDDGNVKSALSRIPIVPRESSKDDQEEDV
jgi:hypothetical protein